jgi:hypothetical protein
MKCDTCGKESNPKNYIYVEDQSKVPTVFPRKEFCDKCWVEVWNFTDDTIGKTFNYMIRKEGK